MYVFYVSGRFQAGRMSNGLKLPGGSPRKDLTRAGGVEAHLYVLYVSGRLQGGRMSNGLKPPGGSAREDLTRAGGGEGGRGGAAPGGSHL